MAFKKLKVTKELEIVSLVDIVFLLLIFGLVILAVSIGHPKDETGPKSDMTLEIKIYRENSNDAYSVVKITYPNGYTTPPETFPPDSVLMRLDNKEFKDLQACRLISKEIKDYKDKYFGSQDPSKSNSIEVKVDNNIKFRILGFIINECSIYGDAIHWLDISTCE